MNTSESQHAQAEALRAASGMSSAERARMWAGFNRYLATEAAKERQLAVEEQEAERQAAEQRAAEQQSDEEPDESRSKRRD